MKLIRQLIQEYETQGVMIARAHLTDGDIQPVIDELSAWIDARARELYAEGRVQNLYESVPFERKYGVNNCERRVFSRGDYPYLGFLFGNTPHTNRFRQE